MALRLFEVILPTGHTDAVRELMEDLPTVGPWYETLHDGQMLARFVLDADQTGAMIGKFEKRFGHVEPFQVLILPVSATMPRLDDLLAQKGGEESKPPDEPKKMRIRLGGGLSQEELYQQVTDMMKLSPIYVAMVLLSGIVATLGMVRDNVAVIIGAMVIAPLLGPNVALAFGATVGDTMLIRKTLVTNLVGIGLSLLLAALCGMILTIDPETPEIASRTAVALSDIVLALASGAAGAIAITTGVPAALVGVMVAVALLPPTVAVGLMAGAGYWSESLGALMLLATNVICVNIAGIVTFLLQGIRPRTWWKADLARRSARIALVFWIGALVTLILLILLSRPL